MNRKDGAVTVAVPQVKVHMLSDGPGEGAGHQEQELRQIHHACFLPDEERKRPQQNAEDFKAVKYSRSGILKHVVHSSE